MNFTDSHCHLDFNEFTESSAQLTHLLNECADKKITRIIVPSVSPNNWQSVLNISEQYSNDNIKISAALGLHPWFLFDNGTELPNTVLNDLAKLCKQNVNNICAIGETGIDSIIAEKCNNLAQQLEFFNFQLRLANTLNKPVIIHHRKSHHHIIPLLKSIKLNKQGVIHAFSGSYQEAKQYLDLGFKLGVGGTITYPRAKKTIETIKKIPLSSIVLETDAPSMPLNGYQGQHNSPLRVVDVFEALCSIRKEDKIELSVSIESNIKRLFSEN